MARKKGLVLELINSRVIILTSSGEFINVAHPGGSIKIGDEIVYGSPFVKGFKIMAAALTLAAALILITIFPLKLIFHEGWEREHGFEGQIIFDINPSFELTYNENLEVKTFVPLNEDAVNLLGNIEKEGQVFTIVNQLINRSIEMGYINPDDAENLVLATLIQTGGKIITSEELADLIENILIDAGIEAFIGIFEATETEHEEALKAGLSLNKYIIDEALTGNSEEGFENDSQFLPELFLEIKDRLPFSEFRITVVPELPPQVPFDAEDLPGPPNVPVEIPIPPVQDDNGKGKMPDLSGLPVPDASGLNNKAGQIVFTP